LKNSRANRQFCAIGSVKSNIGHSRVSGIPKFCYSSSIASVPSLNARPESPYRFRQRWPVQRIAARVAATRLDIDVENRSGEVRSCHLDRWDLVVWGGGSNA
jgi:hypothetical protein